MPALIGVNAVFDGHLLEGLLCCDRRAQKRHVPPKMIALRPGSRRSGDDAFELSMRLQDNLGFVGERRRKRRFDPAGHDRRRPLVSVEDHVAALNISGYLLETSVLEATSDGSHLHDALAPDIYSPQKRHVLHHRSLCPRSTVVHSCY